MNSMRLLALALGSAMALGIKFGVLASYVIPQGGMEPAISAGSRVFINKLAYSSPSDVQRGDVVLIERTENGTPYDYIWRVVALPGESVQVRGATLIIDGKEVPRSPAESGHHAEHLGLEHHLVNLKACTKYSRSVEIELPPDHFFVMGDRRCGAHDSTQLGPIPFEQLAGKQVW